MRTTIFKKTYLSVAVGSFCFALSSAGHAVVVVGGDNGWEVSFDGNVNTFMVLERPDAKPANTVGGTISSDQDSARVRTGLLPAVFAFNVRSPIVNGLRGSARIGFYPQVQNAKTKNQFGSQVDFREAFFKVEGEFGELLMGRALSLFQGKNLLTDMTLFGLGVQGGVDGGGTTLGRIGYGYVYPQFNAGIRYTTPDYSGFKLSAGLFDPSKIAGDVSATETDMPRFETELSYGTTVANGRVLAWLSGMTQSADFATGNSVRSTGIAGGISYDLDMGVGFVLSGYTGKGLGSTLMLDSDSLDSVGEERDNFGFLAQATYTMNKQTKFGLSYGESNADETRADELVRLGTGARQIEKQSSVTLGVYHDVNAWLKVAAEYNYSKNEWYGSGGEQDSNAVGLGAFFLW